MRQRRFVESLTIKLSRRQLERIIALADEAEISLGEATRNLINLGMEARGSDGNSAEGLRRDGA